MHTCLHHLPVQTRFLQRPFLKSWNTRLRCSWRAEKRRKRWGVTFTHRQTSTSHKDYIQQNVSSPWYAVDFQGRHLSFFQSGKTPCNVYKVLLFLFIPDTTLSICRASKLGCNVNVTLFKVTCKTCWQTRHLCDQTTWTVSHREKKKKTGSGSNTPEIEHWCEL